jgi:hypothetical protein
VSGRRRVWVIRRRLSGVRLRLWMRTPCGCVLLLPVSSGRPRGRPPPTGPRKPRRALAGPPGRSGAGPAPGPFGHSAFGEKHHWAGAPRGRAHPPSAEERKGKRRTPVRALARARRGRR